MQDNSLPSSAARSTAAVLQRPFRWQSCKLFGDIRWNPASKAFVTAYSWLGLSAGVHSQVRCNWQPGNAMIRQGKSAHVLIERLSALPQLLSCRWIKLECCVDISALVTLRS
jgi:hypothetical protein